MYYLISSRDDSLISVHRTLKAALIAIETRLFGSCEPVLAVMRRNTVLSGERPIVGVIAMTDRSRVAVMGQKVAADNGIYITSSGEWVRVSLVDTETKITMYKAKRGLSLASEIRASGAFVAHYDTKCHSEVC